MVSLRVWVIAIFTGLLLVAASFVLLSGNAKLGLIVPLPIIGLVVGGLIMPLTETAGGMPSVGIISRSRWQRRCGDAGSADGPNVVRCRLQLISSYVAAAAGALFVLVSKLVTKVFT